MATEGPGIDCPGEWFIAGAPASATTAAGATFGSAAQIIVDNRTDPAMVTIQNALVSPGVAEFYELVAVDTVIAAGAAIPFGTAGPAAGSCAQAASPTVFELNGITISVLNPAIFEISWQISAVEGAAQTQIKCIAGTVNGVAAGQLAPLTLVSRGGTLASANDLLTGDVIVYTNGAAPRFSIVNSSGVNLTLKGNAGGANAVAATLIVRRLQ